MKAYRSLLAIAAVAALAASCGGNEPAEKTGKAEIVATVAGENPVVVAMVLDKTDTLKAVDGKFVFSLDVKEGDPVFVYLFDAEKRIGSFIVKAGDKIDFSVDEDGNAKTEGSEESVRLQEAEAMHAKFLKDGADAIGNLRDYNRLFIAHHREATKFVVSNTKSLSVVYPLLEGDVMGTPVFFHVSDTLIIRSVCDSLAMAYPKSQYVEKFKVAMDERINQIKLQDAINAAEEISYPEIAMKDTKGNVVKLSEVKAKVKMIYFWSSSDPQQRLFNIEKIKPLYDQFKGRGFEIYSVCIDPDRVRWADTINGQGLEWINVNDGLGTDSPVLRAYNVGSLPRMFLIEHEEIVTKEIKGEADLKAEIRKAL